jgi:Uma2 family endonuclease
MAIARQALTLEEFLQLPEEKPALEYWRGEVTRKMSPSGPHAAMQAGFVELVNGVPGLRRLVRVFTELRGTFGGVSTVPDVAVYRRERVPRDADGRVVHAFSTPPDVAVEISSPGQSRREQIERCRWYVANGVALALFLDPIRLVARVFRPGAESGDLRGTDVVDLGDMLPGFVMTVDELFGPLDADWA